MNKIKVKGKIIYLIILVLVAMFASIGTVFAERIIASNKVIYSNGTSGLTSTNVQGALDELYSKYVKCAKSFGNFGCFLQSLEESDTVIADDGTKDHNMRYMGAAPNNYVTFAGEEWRIIGVFNNVDSGTGTKETRVKIIKSDSLGNKLWDRNNENIWKKATLNTELQALQYASNSMVDNAVWYLGDPGGEKYTYTAFQAYTHERGTKMASGNDPTWTGKVGLMYPSDYGFASSGCKDGFKTLDYYNNVTCTGSNWLYISSHEWLLSPVSSDTFCARYVYDNGHIYIGAGASFAVRPVIYLKSSVICKNCSDSTVGTKENPFQIQ